ncbi:hypothetical protein NXV57_10990 [Bacteroides thetaiotaomicron]|nr:hypothetical protein [Bacteroides thetaiotaomicron]
MIDATRLGDVWQKFVEVVSVVAGKQRWRTRILLQNGRIILCRITLIFAILKDYSKDVTIPEPRGYDHKEFACVYLSHGGYA